MKTVIIYDENSLDSTLTAACIASFRNVETCERKGFPDPKADRYIWIGVYPTRNFFPSLNLEEIKRKSHVAFVKVPENTPVHRDVIQGTDFVHSSDEVRSFTVTTVFGEKTFLERLMLYWNQDPEVYSNVVVLIKNFYESKTAQELLWLTCLNMREALYCLENKQIYIPITMNPEVLMDAELCFSQLDYLSTKVINTRGTQERIEDKKQQVYNCYTYYEPSNWWFIRRRFFHGNTVTRNVSLAATGTVVTCDNFYPVDLEYLNPVFVSN